ncbi:MAG: sulfite exporter TauE/SafE family protein [Myxococcota bacterium]
MDLLPWYMYFFAVLGGVLAGVINTLAGSGSLVTLPILVLLGLPADVANGTNRVGIVIQSVVGVGAMRRDGKLRTQGSAMFLLPTLAGSLVGARLASGLDAETMDKVIGLLMVALLGIILVHPKRWLREESDAQATTLKPWLVPVFFFIGVYGGFIQAGVGILLLVGLVLGAGFSLVEANALKLLLALCFTLIALAVFLVHDLVHWPYGLLMGVGQAIGAWGAVRFATRYEGANRWVRRLLIVVVCVGIVRFWGLWDLALEALS